MWSCRVGFCVLGWSFLGCCVVLCFPLAGCSSCGVVGNTSLLARLVSYSFNGSSGCCCVFPFCCVPIFLVFLLFHFTYFYNR